jgi:hypothetical protein
LHIIVKLDGDDLDVVAFTEPVNQQGESDADAGVDLKYPTTFRYRRRESCQQPPHLDLTGKLEAGVGCAFVSGHHALGKALFFCHIGILSGGHDLYHSLKHPDGTPPLTPIGRTAVERYRAGSGDALSSRTSTGIGSLRTVGRRPEGR